jgi:mono/diheme cytochrome c family protein
LHLRQVQVCLLLAVLLAGCALSAPPPSRGNAPLLTPVAPESDVPVELPSRTPSASNGAAVYAQKCTGCHGPKGQGDGEQAAQIQSQFGSPVPDLTTDSVARALTAAEWFGVITKGRIERGMPPFSGSLSPTDRWDVIAFAWSLAAPDTTLAAGKAIYTERCVSCHGETGKGDGPQAGAQKLPDLSDLNTYRDVALGAWDNLLSTSHVPTFSGKLDGNERSAVNSYIRSFTYSSAAVIAQQTTPAATPAANAAPGPNVTPSTQPTTTLTVNGSVVNGTSGAAAPGSLDVTFYYFPGGTNNAPITQTVKADASGRFNVPGFNAKAGDVVAATVTYADVTYPSELITLDGTAKPIDLQVKVYEPTTETTAIHVDTLHIVATQQTDVLEVSEIYVISNAGERVVRNIDGPTLRFNLPAGVTAFQTMSGAAPGAVVQSPEGFDYFDAIPPGTGTVQLVIAYQMPLNADAVFDRVPTYPVASVNLLVQASSLNPSAEQLTDQGSRDIQGQSYRQFSGGPYQNGTPIAFRLVKPGSGADAKLIGAIALLVVGVAGVGYGVWRTRKRGEPELQPMARRPQSPEARREQLIDKIAALDDAFAAGDLDEPAYRKQREKLKAKLLSLTQDDPA